MKLNYDVDCLVLSSPSFIIFCYQYRYTNSNASCYPCPKVLYEGFRFYHGTIRKYKSFKVCFYHGNLAQHPNKTF